MAHLAADGIARTSSARPAPGPLPCLTILLHVIVSCSLFLSCFLNPRMDLQAMDECRSIGLTQPVLTISDRKPAACAICGLVLQLISLRGHQITVLEFCVGCKSHEYLYIGASTKDNQGVAGFGTIGSQNYPGSWLCMQTGYCCYKARNKLETHGLLDWRLYNYGHAKSRMDLDPDYDKTRCMT
uniref:Uncharacterized protein n=1 Tax=Aegilops tauschii TaxID=37682 RepID=N1R110_AEGTA